MFTVNGSKILITRGLRKKIEAPYALESPAEITNAVKEALK